MDIRDAQREVREVYRGGFVGQLVSAVVWLASGVAAREATPRTAAIILVVGGFFIFPLTMLGLRLLGGPWRLSRSNPLAELGMQVAFVLPLCLPLVGAAALYRSDWFSPAFMVLLGAHYLPFAFLYGMRMFAALAAVLIGLGLLFARSPASHFGTPALVTGGVLAVFAVVGLMLVRRDAAIPASAGT